MTSIPFRVITIALSVAVLGGCAFQTPADRQVVDVPAEWRFGQQRNVDVELQWWNQFEHAPLASYIALAQSESPDLRMADERIRQAEYALGNAGAGLLPTLTLSGSSGESRAKADGESWSSGDSSRVSLAMSYELDIWGKLRATRSEARASYNVSVFDYDAAALSMQASIASTYFQWMALEMRLATAQNNLAIAERVFQIVNARYRNGVVTAADVSRQRTTLMSQQAAIGPIQVQSEQTRTALAVLLGQTPQTFDPTVADLMSVTVPAISPIMPSELLTRRPDIASAEAALAAADANLTVARTALLPSISLSAAIGQSSSALFSLSGASTSESWSASLTQAIFQGGRLRNQIGVSESRQRSLVEQYRKTLLTAFKEVDDALLSVANEEQQEYLQEQIVTEAKKTLRITELRYKEGADEMTSLLDAQRSLFSAEDTLIQRRLARLNAAVTLYKALGGGWSIEQ